MLTLSNPNVSVDVNTKPIFNIQAPKNLKYNKNIFNKTFLYKTAYLLS